MRYRAGEAAGYGRSVVEMLRAGEPVLSLGVRHARTGDIARMASGAGYRVVWIDLEHSTMPIDAAAAIAATATDLGLAAWVRVPERDLGTIGRVLDGGATGIIMPKVETAEEARALALACRFPPRGARSMIATLPQAGFRRMPTTEHTARADEAIALQVLIESRRGVEAADAIAAVDGVDILGVGTNDLSADLGCPGQDTAEVREACAAVAAAARRHGKLAVIGGVADGGRFVELLELGFAPLIFAGIDTDVMADGIARRGQDWRERLAALGRDCEF